MRDFRGWLWQNGQCRDLADRMPECLRRTFYSIRLPVELFREALFRKDERLVWPPEDLGQMRVRVEMLAPGEDARPLFDSNAPGAQLAASLGDLSRSLLPGERDLDAVRARLQRPVAEEVVVAKEARVVEEVVINKKVSEHTETVRDTVRRTDVVVEDLAGKDNLKTKAKATGKATVTAMAKTKAKATALLVVGRI